MAINSYQREIYANQLKHAERRNHKYLYKIGDRYIYPEDVKNGEHTSGSRSFGKPKATLNKYAKVQESQKERQKAVDQGKESQNSKYWFSRGGMEAYLNSSHYKNSDEYKLDNARYKNSADYIGFHKKMEERDRKYERAAHPTTKTQQIEATQREQRKKTRQRKEIAKAHQGYTEDRKKFPEGGSTEELERQKQKTAERKALPGRQKDSARQSELERRSSSNLLRRESDALRKAKSDTAKRNIDQQRKSAHAGYADWKNDNDMSYQEYLEKMSNPEYAKKEANKKKRGIFTDTTKELERQKEKTKARKKRRKK